MLRSTINYFSITSQILVREAKKMGFEVEILQPEKNLFIIKGNGKEVLFKSNDFGGDSALGSKIEDDKELTNIILDRNGFNIPRSIYIKKEEINTFDLLKTKLRFPLVTKPIDEGHGNGVTVGIETNEELEYGINEAFRFGKEIIIQDFIEGDEHRILVIGEKVVLGIRRIPAFVTGDFIHTIRELIDTENKNPLRGNGYEKPLAFTKIDESLINYIKKNGLNLESIPEKDIHIRLRGVSNLGAGGVPMNVTEELGEDLKNECIEIAKLVGLKVVGIDIITKDLGVSLKKSKGAIIEINSNPGFGGDLELTGINTGKELLKYIFIE